MTVATPIITVENLKVWYGDHSVINGINFVVYPGEIFLIIGSSGGGKTTLLRSMLGLHQELSGKILIDGADIVTSHDKMKQDILHKVGVMYQSGALFGSMTLLENVMFPLEELSNLPRDVIETIAKSKLAMVGLTEFADFMPAELSGGMQKRAAIARAMVMEPKIIFLDEPSSGLDPTTSIQLDNLILTLSQMLHITFVIVTHELASIFKIGQRVIMLHDKKIIAEGNPQVLLETCNDTVVQKFFHRQA
jgi:phospholipid/cholesterol/gamma-HCH transport system ATP-binding protein